MEKNTKAWFHEGRGSVSAKLAKSNEEVMHEESETMEEGLQAYPEQGGHPISATGKSPFHEGRGLGRGHGPETK